MNPDSHHGSDSAGAKAAFHKPSNDPSSRKYRRRSPVTGSSSSDGDPVPERSSTPTHSLDDNAKLNDNRQRKDDRRDIDTDHKRSRYSRDDSGSYRNSDRRSYNDRRHDDYRRREKYADEDHKNFHKLSPRSGGHGSYSGHARTREFEQNRSKDDVSKHSRDSYRSRDEDRSRRSKHPHKDTSWRESRVEKRKSHFKEPKEVDDDKSVLVAKKSKFSSNKDTEYSKDANEVQSSSSKQEFVGKANSEQDFVKESDIDAAKIAAMRAAELVNRNLIGTGIMSTDQKKKLLWGSKKSTPAEETAHRWDTSMFSDRERQEKFNKLMSLRLHWPIVGCERGGKNGAESRDPRQQSCREAERASDGFGEAVHRWPSSQRWPHCRFRALKTYFRTLELVSVSVVLMLPFDNSNLIATAYTDFLPAVDFFMF